MKRITAIALALMLLVGVAACDTAGNGDQTTAGGNAGGSTSAKIPTYNISADPRDGLEVRLGQTTSSVNMFITINGYLFREGAGGELIPELAESYTVSEDGLTYTVKMRDGLKSSVGNVIDVDDVIYSWSWVLDPNNASEYAFIMYYIKGAEAFNCSLDEGAAVDYETAKANLGLKKLDNLTLEITLEAPTPYFHTLFPFSTYAVLDAEFAESVAGSYGTSVDTVASTGPFKVTQWEKSQYILAERNENYVNAADVKLDGIKFTLVETMATTLTLFETDEVDMIFGSFPTSDINRFESENNPEFYKQAILGNHWVAFNLQESPFDDIRVRLALYKALDIESIATVVMGGGAMPADGMIPSSMPSPADASQFFRTEPLVDPAGDIAEAQRLLAEAGYPNGEGFPTNLKVSHSASNDVDRAIAETMCAMWKDNLGITLSTDGQEAKARSANRIAGNFDICFQGWGGDYADPTTFLDCLLSGHYYNYGKYNSAAYDGHLAAAAATMDGAVRQQELLAAEKQLMEDMPIIMISYTSVCYMQSDRLTGVYVSPNGVFDLTFADFTPAS